jgi:Flp pilus assembly protein TadB
MTAVAALVGLIAGSCLIFGWWSFRGQEPSAAVVAPDPYAAPRRRRMDRLGLRASLAVVAAVGLWLITQWPVGALLAGAGGFMIPSTGSGRAARRMAMGRMEAVAVWAEMLRDVLAAGGGLEQSIVVTARVAPPAIAEQVSRLAARIGRGDDLVDGLLYLACDLENEMADQVVAGLVMAARRNPDHLSELLSALAEVTRDKIAMHRRIETARVSVRSSIRLITIITAAFSGGLLLLNDDYIAVYRGLSGQLVLLAVVGLFAGAHLWVSRATGERTGQRVLAGVDPAAAAAASMGWEAP